MNLLSKMTLALTTVAAASFTSCNDSNQEKAASVPMIEKHNPVLKKGDRMTPELLFDFGRVGSMQLSPDKKKVLYTVSYVGLKENKSNSEIFVVNTDGTDKRQLTHTPYSESEPAWINEGKEIVFIYPENGVPQLWKMNADGTGRTCISDVKSGVNGFKFSPDEKKVLYVTEIESALKPVDEYPDLDQATGRHISDLMFKHWNEWVETIPHPFVADYNGTTLNNAVDLLEGEPYESPMKPFGGVEQLDWSRDGKTIAYTCRKKVGLDYAVSTNSDIYLYDIEKKTTVNLSEGMMGYDQNPVFSPDGNYLAWESMEHDGWESDKSRLFICNLQTGEKRDLSTSIDFNVEQITWAANSKALYFTGCWHAVTQIYRCDLNGKIEPLTKGAHDYLNVKEAGDRLIAMRQSLSAPTEIYAVNPKTGEATDISQENKALTDKLEMGRVEERWIETTDHKQMLVWVIYPPHFDKNKKYPALLYCQGGPQSTVSQFWSYRWHLQTFAASDYIIVAPNRRGVPGFGKEWLESISGDYGGQCMQDYFSAIDAVAKEPFVDEQRLGCVGASFGGYSVYWMAGNHNKRFKAFVSHCGIFNFEQQGLETEELWFLNRDFGGTYWQTDNDFVKRTYPSSPHRFVDKWDTPILVIHGEKDFRILASQGMAAYTAAKLRGIPAEMLIFPDECHWVTKPQNSLQWYRTFIGWLDRWLK